MTLVIINWESWRSFVSCINSDISNFKSISFSEMAIPLEDCEHKASIFSPINERKCNKICLLGDVCDTRESPRLDVLFPPFSRISRDWESIRDPGNERLHSLTPTELYTERLQIWYVRRAASSSDWILHPI